MKNFFSLNFLSSRVVNLALANPVFFLFLFVSCLLLIATIGLRISGVSKAWERGCAGALLFCGAALAVWLAYFVNPRLSVYHWILIIWAAMAGMFLFVKLFGIVEDKILLRRSRVWRCPRCRQVNTNVFVRCLKCNASREN